jgi:hypothetical protein
VREESLAVREGDPLGSRKLDLVDDGDAVNVRPDHATRQGWGRGKRNKLWRVCEHSGETQTKGVYA